MKNLRKMLMVMLVAIFVVGTFASCDLFHEHSFGEWIVTIEPTCTATGVKTRTCECGETETEEIAIVAHTWLDATCTAPNTCSACKATEGEALGHTWADATCTAPKTCNTCKVTEGEALGHTWVDATFEAPKTCSVCHKTEGAALDKDANKELDAFNGIEFIADRISPYCVVVINNQGCSLDAQKYVEYSFDKETYANGDTVTVTAELNYSGKCAGYSLISSQYSFVLSDMPEYISTVQGVDLTFLREELDDYVTAKIASAIGTQDFLGDGVYYPNSYWRGHIDSITSFGATQEYLSTIKLIRQDSVCKDTPYNKYSFVYSFLLKGHYNETSVSNTLYVSIEASNIIKYPDGSIKWGTASPNDFDFTYQTDLVGVENCITTNIMNDSADYNITKITK